MWSGDGEFLCCEREGVVEEKRGENSDQEGWRLRRDGIWFV